MGWLLEDLVGFWIYLMIEMGFEKPDKKCLSVIIFEGFPGGAV